METRFLLLSALLICAATAEAARADLTYLGPGPRRDTAIVRDSARGIRELRKGETLPEVGELRTIDDDEAVFDRVLGHDERQHLRATGAVAPDIQRLHLYRHREPTGAPSAGRGSLAIHGN